MTVCEDKGIRSMDHDRYDVHGHHGPEGQAEFARHVGKIVEERRLWN